MRDLALLEAEQEEIDRESGGEADETSSPSSPSSGEAAVPSTTDTQVPSRPYRYTPRQYLVRERRAEYRSEYFDGDVVAMAGASERHVAIAQNISAHLYFRMGSGCRVYQTDLKVQIELGSGFAYPDVMVLCGEARFVDRVQDVVTNPTVVFEVLSPGTERHDRSTKARAYRRVESLAAYVLVSQKEPRVEVYARGAGGEWPCTVYQRLEDRVALPAVGCELTLAEVYRNLFPAPT
ncbi:MAG TPA: Uma2 family endonuclease [Longimicrobium sp.]|nr:Uma2 family endonuclease [Longimicrobium sp.]